MTSLSRETRETRVRIVLGRDTGAADAASAPVIATTEPFLDHMLVTLARYAGLRLGVDAAGDLRHHLVEDVGITLGIALRRETPAACARYGSATVPMDDALVHAALDLGGRFYYEGPIPSSLYDHFLRSLAENAGMTLHVRVLRGRDRHHVVEAAVKAVGLAVRQALAPEGAVFSTKGGVRITGEENS
jgi:imidazoleglycerol-phosphate dehydratase